MDVIEKDGMIEWVHINIPDAINILFKSKDDVTLFKLT